MFKVILILFFLIQIDCRPNVQCDLDTCKQLDVHSDYKGKKELCDFCYILLPLTRRLIENHETIHFRHIATDLCKELKIADETVCDLAIKTYEVT